MLVKEIIFVLFLIFLQTSSIDEDIPVGTFIIPEEDDVLILNEDNFDHVVTTKDIILVEFYAPWCGHCKSLAPEYAAAAKELKLVGIRIAKVDASIEKTIAARYEVSGYPTLKLFKKGFKPQDFDGSRTAQGIIDYMKKNADPNYEPPPSVVVELDGESFPEFIEEYDLSLIQFFAPWCGHCKALAPEYEAAALDLRAEGIILAKVDAADQRDLASEYKVTGYPTIFIFRRGSKFEYKGPRDRTGIVSHMRDQALPPSKQMTSLRDIVKRAPHLSVYIFASFDNDHLSFFKEYQSAANEIRDDFTFMHSFDVTIASKLHVENNSVNIFFQPAFHSKFEPVVHSLTKVDSASGDILAWMRDHLTPLVGQRTKSNTDVNYKSRPLLVVYYDVDFGHQYIKDTQFIRNKILPVANRHRDITFAISKEQEFMDELKSFGLDDSGEDVNAVIFNQRGLRFPMEPDDFSEEQLEQFVQNYKIGAIKPFLKSKPIPKVQEGPVLTIVAQNFDAEVMQNEKDVFIEFFAPWCAHCKHLEPVYKELARYAKIAHPDLIVAKMDATANDVPPMFTIKGLPTMYFIKGTDKANPFTYEGDGTLDGFKKFILKHSTTPLVKEEL